MHNSIFPQTKYELYGFTGIGCQSIYPVLQQNYIPGATEATPLEIEKYMTSLGFTKISASEYRINQIVISDLHPRNVLKDEDGDLFVIDADFIHIDV